MSIAATLCETCYRLLSAARIAGAKVGNAEHYRPSSGAQASRLRHEVNHAAVAGCPVCKWIVIGSERSHMGDGNKWIRIHFDVYLPVRGRDYTLKLRIEHNFELRGKTDFEIQFEVLDATAKSELIPYSSLPERSNNSKRSVQITRRWFWECDKTHKECQPLTRNGWRPTRLVHIEEVGGSIRAQVHSAGSDDYTRAVQYTAISHRWFAEDTNKLTWATFREYRKSIPTQTLKPSLYDAMVITLNLGLSYLWVDSLCIIQDDKDDKLSEITNMHRIYGQATCTIAANRAQRIETGLFAVRDPALINKYTVEHSTVSGPETLLLYLGWHESGSSEYEDSFLRDRGWCFQERLLSCRILHCSQQQYQWECRRLQGSEAWPLGSHYDSGYKYRRYYSIGILFSNPEEVLDNWFGMVKDYSSCAMTIAGDRLHGIQGVASFCEALMSRKATYRYGHWNETMLLSLLWIVTPLDVRPGGHMQEIAPSWSWGSRIVTIRWQGESDRSVSAKIVPTPHDLVPLNTRLIDSVLAIEGWTWTDEMQYSERKYANFTDIEAHLRSSPRRRVHPDTEDQHRTVTCLCVQGVSVPYKDLRPIADIGGLILIPSTTDPRMYHRIGVYTMDQRPPTRSPYTRSPYTPSEGSCTSID